MPFQDLDEFTWYNINIFPELSYKPDSLPFVLITDGKDNTDIATWRPEGAAWLRSPPGWYNFSWERSFIQDPIVFMKIPSYR